MVEAALRRFESAFVRQAVTAPGPGICGDVLASLSLTDPVERHLDAKLLALDAAWKQMAGRSEEAGDDALVRVVTPADGHARLSVEKLGALGESASLTWLRAACQAMLPRIDLPELLLEVYSWTGFLDAYVHPADISTRMHELSMSARARTASSVRAKPVKPSRRKRGVR
ncbi:hypothetical protein GCM10010176_088940 [Nonomuraea spiralis]|nr:hypothetical protein GCM10010176_088940 [Nonomuraea spiralis]